MDRVYGRLFKRGLRFEPPMITVVMLMRYLPNLSVEPRSRWISEGLRLSPLHSLQPNGHASSPPNIFHNAFHRFLRLPILPNFCGHLHIDLDVDDLICFFSFSVLLHFDVQVFSVAHRAPDLRASHESQAASGGLRPCACFSYTLHKIR